VNVRPRSARGTSARLSPTLWCRDRRTVQRSRHHSLVSVSTTWLTKGTPEVCAAIAAESSKERAQLLVRDWWLASDRSPEDVRAVLACKVWGGEPCRVVEPEIWVAIWRRAGFINIVRQPRPTVRTRVFRAAEPAVKRGLSWTPDHGYAEMWRAAAKAPTLDASAERARHILAGNLPVDPGSSTTSRSATPQCLHCDRIARASRDRAGSMAARDAHARLSAGSSAALSIANARRGAQSW